MNILVTGTNGQLGSCIRDVAAGSTDNYIFTDVAELDITDREAVKRMVKDNDVEVVINCAAYTNVDKAEDDVEFATILNADAVANLAEAVKENNGMLIHVSTDYVFGGNVNNTPCTEDQQPNPTGVYGKTKLEGERRIAESGCRALIFRTAWLYSEYGKNFVKTMLSLTSTKPELNVIFDQTGTPTYARDLAKAIVGIVSQRAYEGKEGIYHYSNEGVCSWYDFTKIIAEYSGNTECMIRPCHSSEFPSKVIRPSYSVLDKTKFKETFGVAVPYWTDSLKKCISNLRSNEA
ncbi:MAG: dTDP-4-dehydrorhamnose reductase [Muribaculaceae bacterium]|nr:dTDP-4-dehydrorhamnose reductase [Muribaculaceae bacterium]